MACKQSTKPVSAWQARVCHSHVQEAGFWLETNGDGEESIPGAVPRRPRGGKAAAAAGQRSAQGGESRALGGQEVALGLEDATGHTEEASLDSFHNVDDRGQDSSLGTDNSSDDVLNRSNNVIT